MSKFFRPSEYFKPKTLSEALSLLEKYDGTARPIAGATDLFVKKNPEIKQLVDIRDIGLNYIEEDGSDLVIGATTTLSEIEDSPTVKGGSFRALREAVHQIGCVQVRNTATIGGNLCNASPAADSASVLIAMDATARIVGPKGERDVPLEEFFQGPGKTVLGSSDLLKELRIPTPSPNSGIVFMKIGRTAVDIALVNASVRVTFRSKTSICGDARIVLGAVAPVPMRARKAEKLLVGNEISDDNIVKVAETAAAETQPISDVRASAAYRREMSKVLIRRAIKQAFAGIKVGSE